jgi:hypothetical protein
VQDVHVLHAFIDESGVRGISETSSDHFVMSAVVWRERNAHRATELLAQLRAELNRKPGQSLAWKYLKTHGERQHIARLIGEQPWLKLSNVVVCKRFLASQELMDDYRYLYTLRFLLERLSWLARDEGQGEPLAYTLAHIKRFKIAKLRQYETALKNQATQIQWASLDPAGGSMIHPEQREELQLADLCASAVAAAFEPTKFGLTERGYLEFLKPRLYRRKGGLMASYGMKMHPWTDSTRAAYPWVTAL